MSEATFFESWAGLLRVASLGVCSYAALILILRTSGKRTLSKMNAFDLVVTVALGSTLATIVLSKNVVLAEGVAALCLLVYLQFAVSWLSVRWRFWERVIKSEPKLLFSKGEFLPQAMKAERVNEAEVLQAMRSHGFMDRSRVAAVVLETDGTFSVLPTS